jgi:mRNA interferase RelE/StbE
VAAYSLFLKASAAKEIESLPTRAERTRVVARIRALSTDPRPPGSEKLAGEPDRYRVRQGRYRIVYSIRDREKRIEIVRVAHRKEVYRSAT